MEINSLSTLISNVRTSPGSTHGDNQVVPSTSVMISGSVLDTGDHVSGARYSEKSVRIDHRAALVLEDVLLARLLKLCNGSFCGGRVARVVGEKG